MAEQLAFDLLARDRMSAPFRGAGRAVEDLSAKMGIGARSARVLQEAIDKQAHAADASIRATLSLAKADKILADAEHVLADGALEADFALRREADAAKKAAREQEEAAAKTRAMNAALGKATPGWLSLASAAAAFGPAALPVLGAATAATLGLGAALAGAGSALGIFALAAKGNLTEMQKQLLKVQAANKSANLAEQTAAKDRTAAQKQAIVNARQLTAAFHQEFGAEASAIEKLKSAWLSFVTQPVVTSTLVQGMRLITAALPHLTPLLKLGAYWAQALMGALGGFVTGGGLDRLVAGLVRIGRVSLTGFLAILHNLAVAIGALGPSMGQFSTAVVGGLVRLSAAFASWAQNKGAAALSGFFAYVKQSAPQVGQLLRNLAAVLPVLAKGLFPLAPLSLALSTALTGIVAALPPGIITAIAVGFVAWTVAVKGLVAANALGGAWKAVVKFAAVAEGATVAQTVAAAATTAWGLAMDALPFIAIAAAVALLVVVIVKYHKQIWAFVVRIWGDIWGFMKRVWGDILSFARQWWPLLLGPSGVIVKYHQQIWGFIQRIWNSSIIPFFRGLPSRILRALFGLGHSLYAFAHAALTEFWNGLKSVAGSIFGWVGNFVKTIWNKVKGFFGISSPSSLFYDIGKNLMLGLFHGIQDHAHHAATAARTVSQSVSGALGGDQAANARLARSLFPWPADQWGSFYNLEMAEAGFNRFARNPSSGAYGIPQALPESKLPFAGQAAGGSHAGAQLSWMFSYIAGRYGSPVNAWAHELKYHWYDQGGWLPPGISVAINKTGYAEQVIPRGRGGGDRRVVLEVRSGGSRMDDLIVEIIRHAVRVDGGGDAQLALGRDS